MSPLNATKPSSAKESARLNKLLENLRALLNKNKSIHGNIADLRKKLDASDARIEDLKAAAPDFNPVTKLNLVGELHVRTDINDAIAALDTQVHDDRAELFQAIDEGQEAVRLACQVTHADLLG